MLFVVRGDRGGLPKRETLGGAIWGGWLRNSSLDGGICEECTFFTTCGRQFRLSKLFEDRCNPPEEKPSNGFCQHTGVCGINPDCCGLLADDKRFGLVSLGFNGGGINGGGINGG